MTTLPEPSIRDNSGRRLSPQASLGRFSSRLRLRERHPRPEEVWGALMEGNRRFVAGVHMFGNLPNLRAALRFSQQPIAAVLGCSDSRVPPELVFDQTLGGLFVVRSAGNVADGIAVGSIEYAVEQLGTGVLVVLGHTRCGAVIAACSAQQRRTRYLRTVLSRIAPAVRHAGALARGGEELVEAVIRENIHRSACAMLAASTALRGCVEAGALTVIEAEYQLDSGEVIRLDHPPG